MAKNKHAELLKTIVAETAKNGFATVKVSDELKQLAAEKKVELHPNGPDSEGNIAVKPATPVTTDAPAATSAPVTPPKVTLESGVFLPPEPAKPNRRKEEVYPFTTMEVGQSFVVPVSATLPDPFKVFSSTIGSVMRRLSVPDPTGKTKLNRKKEPVPVKVQTKQFTIRKVKAGDTYPGGYVESVDGARIYRSA